MKKRAYTIVEMLIAVVIIMVLAVLTTVYLTRARSNSKLTRITAEMSEINAALTQYAEDNNYIYPPDVTRSVPPGLERYLLGGTWPRGPWTDGVYDWDNWTHPTSGRQIYQITYRLCDTTDPESACADPVLFPNFVRNSGIFYCISGPCIPHNSSPSVPGYCVNCNPPQQNYGPNSGQNGAGAGWRPAMVPLMAGTTV